MTINKYFYISDVFLSLKNKNSYEEINKGYFEQAQDLSGYIINLSKKAKFDLYLILNDNKEYYTKDTVKNINDVIFIVVNLYKLENGLENFINNLEKHSKLILTLIEKAFESSSEKKSDDKEIKYNIPYGYKKVGGNIEVDKKEEQIVKNIFNLYNKLKSMKKVAEMIRNSGAVGRNGERFDVGVVSHILHDKRYLDKKYSPNLIPPSIFNKTADTLRRNLSKSREQTTII